MLLVLLVFRREGVQVDLVLLLEASVVRVKFNVGIHCSFQLMGQVLLSFLN